MTFAFSGQGIEANNPTEVTLSASADYVDPFNEVILDAIFTQPDGKILRAPAFWDGGKVWKIRYASSQVGTHTYRTECSAKGDVGLEGQTGTIEVTPYRGTNALFQHGAVVVAGDHRHFSYADGAPFFWLGDTWWMGLCHRLEWPAEFKTLTADRVAKGFTVIQIVAGLYPDMPPFDPRGANEAGFPWEANYSRIRPEYFDAVDRRLEHLVNSGLTPCLVGAWGYFLPWMGVEKAKQHWRYLIARYGSLPIIWCAAGEANLPYYLTKGFPFDDRTQVAGWSEVMHHIRETDPFHRLLSIHPTGLGRLSARGAVTNDALLDFDMLQTGHGLREVLSPTLSTLRTSYASEPVMPVINSEVSYEMLGDHIPAEIPRLMFWASMMNGAAGHSYGANGIWQCNRPGEPHGTSPHGGSYGVIPWNQAMNLPGSRQLGLAKRFLERLPWQQLEPHPDWVAWADSRRPIQWGQWIWFPEGDPKTDAPVEARYFRRWFDLPQDFKVKRAELFASADGSFTAWVNANPAGSGADWHHWTCLDIHSLVRPGSNLVAIKAENGSPDVKPNPAGLLARLEIESISGEQIALVSDSEWRASRPVTGAWADPKFDDSKWPHAAVLAAYGERPWGKLSALHELVEPFAASLNRSVLAYLPDPRPVFIRHLQPNVAYHATMFDPVEGGEHPIGDLRAAPARDLWFDAPAAKHDWVVLLEPTRD
jgi:hypothetical protein